MSWENRYYREDKREQARELKNQIDDFLKNGGQIKIVPRGMSGMDVRISRKERDILLTFKGEL